MGWYYTTLLGGKACNFQLKPFRGMILKQIWFQMTNNDDWNHVGSPGHPILSSTRYKPWYKIVCKIEFTPNDQ